MDNDTPEQRAAESGAPRVRIVEALAQIDAWFIEYFTNDRWIAVRCMTATTKEDALGAARAFKASLMSGAPRVEEV